MNLAPRDIRHNLGRFLLTCVGLSLLLGIVLAMVGIYRGLVFESLGLTRAFGAQVWVVEGKTRGPFAEASRLPGDIREGIAIQWGVADAGAVYFQNVDAQHGGEAKQFLVVGAEIGRLGEASAIVEGRPIGSTTSSRFVTGRLMRRNRPRRTGPLNLFRASPEQY